jgi:hypothetical protein
MSPTRSDKIDGEDRDPLIDYALEHAALFVAFGATLVFTAKVLVVARLEPGIALALVTSADTTKFLAGMFVSLAPTLVSVAALLSWLRWTGTVRQAATVYFAVGATLTVLTALFSPLTETGVLLFIVATIIFGKKRGTVRVSRGLPPMAALGALFLLLNYIVFGPLWMPTEALAIESRGGKTQVTEPYYVVEEEGPWLTVLRAEDITLQRVRLDAITARNLCRRDYTVPAALIHVLAPPIDVPGCVSQSISVQEGAVP